MKLYEKYHSKRKLQKRVISDDDFTYTTIIGLLRKYIGVESTVLDIGCGVGTIDFYLGKRGNKVQGIDISKNAILKAKQNAAKLGVERFVKFYVLDFPRERPKGKFDAIVCSEVLEHLSNDKEAVDVISGLVKKNGVVIASVPSKNAPLYKIGVLKKFDREVGHLRRYSDISFRNLFKHFSILEIIKTEGVLRNFLYTNSVGGFMLKVLIRKPFSIVLRILDNLLVPIFGESNIFLVARMK